MNSVLQFLLEILKSPQLLLGLIVFIGLVAQKQPTHEVIRGTLKATLGFVILGAGAGILIGSLDYFGQLFQEAFNVQGVVPNNEAIVARALVDYATYTAGIMVIGMAANIFIARFTRLKYIFLTGHHTLYMAALIAVVLEVAGLSGTLLYIVGGMALGLVMVLFPALGQKYMPKVTGTEDIAIGHFSTTTYFLSGLVGGIVGKNSKSTEELNVPKSLSFLRDSSVAVSITMLVMFLITTIKAGPDFVANQLGIADNYIIFAFIQSLTFAAGVYIILQGVRMIISEIVPAFKGWSEKIVPDAKPALDCPIVFPYAPNAVVLGFLVSFLGGIIGMIILILIGGVVILPGVIPHFFLGATAAVFGNATGGRRGAIIGSFVNGLVISFLPLLLLPVLGNLGFENTTFGDADFVVVGTIIGTFAAWGKWAVTALVAVLFAIPFVDAALHKEKA